MIQFIVAFVSTALIYMLLDLVFVSRVALPYVFNRIHHLIEINLLAVGVFYVVFVLGILLFAVYPALSATDVNIWHYALLMGGLFGFFTYATYDLVNMATLRDWTWSMVFIDIAWGTILVGTSATAGYCVTKTLVG